MGRRFVRFGSAGDFGSGASYVFVERVPSRFVDLLVLVLASTSTLTALAVALFCCHLMLVLLSPRAHVFLPLQILRVLVVFWFICTTCYMVSSLMLQYHYLRSDSSPPYFGAFVF